MCVIGAITPAVSHVGEVPGAGVGTPVTLWGEGLSADEVGAAAGTLSYELFTKLTARVPIVEVP